MKRWTPALAGVLVLLVLAPVATSQVTTTTAVLWAGTAAEHRAAYLQAYSVARVMLDKALSDKSWTAAVEQEGAKFRSLPPAVILDIDETVLDNIPDEARRALSDEPYSEDAWQLWVDQARAVALPGAAEFTKYANSRGVKIFYITNRTSKQKAATRANLLRAGFPMDLKIETLYCKGDRTEWNTSDKGGRRAEIAKSFRVLLLVGDDLGDFVSGASDTVERRTYLVDRYNPNWGTRWILLPNAMYGSWAKALTPTTPNPPPEQVHNAELQALKKLQEGHGK